LRVEYLRQRAEEVGYSVQILYQELRARDYRGSYQTVKLFVRPLRPRASSAEQSRATQRFLGVFLAARFTLAQAEEDG
jgi:hypothetical protein